MEDRDFFSVFKNGVLEDETAYIEFVRKAQDAYKEYAFEIIGEDKRHFDLFSWITSDLTMHFVHIESQNERKQPIIFTTKYLGEDYIVHDATHLTNSFLDKMENNKKVILTKLFQKDFFDFESKEIISCSFGYSDVGIRPHDYASRYVRDEYNQAKESLNARSIELIKFNDTKLYKDFYDFESLLKELDNKQFEAELLECIDCYNHEKFFVSAAGLGAVLEHLLHIIIEKHNVEKTAFPKNPTHKDYIAHMKKEPINIDNRQKSYIDSLFTLRNSVSHFNKGFTSKSICNQMMDGIVNIFNNYYHLKL